MPKFRKKPVVVEAVQWTGSNLWDDYCDLVKRKGLKIKTLEGWLSAPIGDWIIKGVAGEFYPCKPDIFEKTYENITTDAVKSCEGVNPVGV